MNEVQCVLAQSPEVLAVSILVVILGFALCYTVCLLAKAQTKAKIYEQKYMDLREKKHWLQLAFSLGKNPPDNKLVQEVLQAKNGLPLKAVQWEVFNNLPDLEIGK